MNNCIVCNVATPPTLTEDNGRSTADGAVLFESRGGNYGSTVYDQGGSGLKIAVCDPCLLKRREVVIEEIYGTAENAFGRDYEVVIGRRPWDPDRKD